MVQFKQSSVRITFPASVNDFNELDAWLESHPTCECVLIDCQGIGRRDFNRLMKLKDLHHVVVAVSPTKRCAR